MGAVTEWFVARSPTTAQAIDIRGAQVAFLLPVQWFAILGHHLLLADQRDPAMDDIWSIGANGEILIVIRHDISPPEYR
jgi:hypothetical protein